MSQFHDNYSSLGNEDMSLPPALLQACETDFDALVDKHRYVNDLINAIAIQESSHTESVFDDLYEIATGRYGNDGDEIGQEGSAFIDGGILAMAAADIFATHAGVDPMTYRIRFHDLVDSGIDNDVLAANFGFHIQLHQAFNSTYDAISAAMEESTTESIQGFHDGFESTLTVATQCIREAKAAKDLQSIKNILNDGVLLDNALKVLLKKEGPSADTGVTDGVYPELIPEEFSSWFDPLADMDVALISDYMVGRIFSAEDESPREVIRYLHKRHTIRRHKLVERLVNIGKYVEPYNDELLPVDDELTRMSAFTGGMTIALSVVEMISSELGNTGNEWAVEWVKLSRNYDSPEILLEKRPRTSEECARVGKKIIEIGGVLWDKLPPEFQAMIEKIEGQLINASTHVNIFRASFAYIYFFGREVLAQTYLNEKEDDFVEGMMPSDKYFEDERKFFLGT